MKYAKFLLLGAVVAFSFGAIIGLNTKAEANSMCGTPQEVLASHDEQNGEALALTGTVVMMGQRAKMNLLINPSTQTWAIIIERTDGTIACLLTKGIDISPPKLPRKSG